VHQKHQRSGGRERCEEHTETASWWKNGAFRVPKRAAMILSGEPGYLVGAFDGWTGRGGGCPVSPEAARCPLMTCGPYP
jgi:hypothetical protein